MHSFVSFSRLKITKEIFLKKKKQEEINCSRRVDLGKYDSLKQVKIKNEWRYK